MQQAGWQGPPGGGFVPQQQGPGWQQGPYPPYANEQPEPEPPAGPQTREGYKRLSNRVFVVPAEASPAEVVSELSDVYGLVTQEKCAVPISPEVWADEAAFSADLNKIFKVKGIPAYAAIEHDITDAMAADAADPDAAAA